MRILVTCFLFFISSVFSYEYRTIKWKDHLVHVATFDLGKYELKLVNGGEHEFKLRHVDEIAKEKGAIAAINAGFFLEGEYHGRPAGVFYSKELDLKLSSPKLRGAIAWNCDGDHFKFGRVDTLDDDWLSYDYVIGGAPLMLFNRQIQNFWDEKTKETFLTLPHARSAIGITDSGKLVLAKAEGHRLGHKGFNMDDWADFLRSINWIYALNLDGGSASSLYLDGQYITEAKRRVGNVLILVEKSDIDYKNDFNIKVD